MNIVPLPWLLRLLLLTLGGAFTVSQAATPNLYSADYHVFLVAGKSNAQDFNGLKDEGLNEFNPVPEPVPGFRYNMKKKEILDTAPAGTGNRIRRNRSKRKFDGVKKSEIDRRNFLLPSLSKQCAPRAGNCQYALKILNSLH